MTMLSPCFRQCLRLVGVLGPWPLYIPWPLVISTSAVALELYLTSKADEWIVVAKMFQGAMTIAFAFSCLWADRGLGSVFKRLEDFDALLASIYPGISTPSDQGPVPKFKGLPWVGLSSILTLTAFLVFCQAYEHLMPPMGLRYVPLAGGVSRFLKYAPHLLTAFLHVHIITAVTRRMDFLLGMEPAKAAPLHSRLSLVLPLISSALGPSVLLLNVTLVGNLLVDVYCAVDYPGHSLPLAVLKTIHGTGVLVAVGASTERLQRKCGDLRRAMFEQKTPKIGSEQMLQTAYFLQRRSPNVISCLGLFDVNMSSLAKLSHVIVTYSIVLVQTVLEVKAQSSKSKDV